MKVKECKKFLTVPTIGKMIKIKRSEKYESLGRR
jgi:hypothetical protein